MHCCRMKKAVTDMLCRFLQQMVTVCTFVIIGLLAIPMLLSLLLMAVVWSAADLILIHLERKNHSRLTTYHSGSG